MYRGNANPHQRSRIESLRAPTGADATAMRDLAAATGVLDVNSTYAYLLMAVDFAATSIVAEHDGELCGFITGYHPPARPEVLFVWQVAVAESARGGGLAGGMLDALAHRVRTDRCGHPLTVETTVTASNTASRALFAGFARRHGVALTEHDGFAADLLDTGGDHEAEPMLRIGPLIAPLDPTSEWRTP